MPKITKVLNGKGINVSQKRVAKRMRLLGLRIIAVKKYNHAGKSNPDDTKDYLNLLEQAFLRKNQVKNGLEILLIFILKRLDGRI